MMANIRIENEIRSHFCGVKNVIQNDGWFGHTEYEEIRKMLNFSEGIRLMLTNKRENKRPSNL